MLRNDTLSVAQRGIGPSGIRMGLVCAMDLAVYWKPPRWVTHRGGELTISGLVYAEISCQCWYEEQNKIVQKLNRRVQPQAFPALGQQADGGLTHRSVAFGIVWVRCVGGCAHGCGFPHG